MPSPEVAISDRELPKPPRIEGPESRTLIRRRFKDYKDLIDKKFPLVSIQGLESTETVNRAVTGMGVYDFLHRDADETRHEEPQEHIKVSFAGRVKKDGEEAYERQNITIILINDQRRPKVILERFDASDDSQPPARISRSDPNSTEASRLAGEMLERLRGLRSFSLIYPPEAA